MDNPLLQFDTLPDFSRIEASHFLPAIEQLIVEGRDGIEKLLANTSQPGWGNFLYPMEAISDRLDRAWSVISHLNGVCNTTAIREAYAECLPRLTEYSTWLGQHAGLYRACQSLKAGEQYAELTGPQQQALDNMLRDFALAGIHLEADQQQRYAQIKSRQAELSTTFSNQVLDSTEAYELLVKKRTELQGAPDSWIDAAAERATLKGMDGYLLTLDLPSYLPFMQYCINRDLREKLYFAYVTRASELCESGRWDNSDIMEETLALRRELAELLGFANYAELSLATKMAGSTEEVFNFLQQLASHSTAIARQEFDELQQFARAQLNIECLEAWDVPFASEALRLSRFDLSQEELREYFPADTVIRGMFEVVNRLYGIEIQVGQAPSCWHDEVRFYDIHADGQLVAQFYLDLFAREGKRGGAWMADCQTRRCKENGEIQIPVAFLVCNFTPPTEQRPSLLTHMEVTTLFHEFGHGLHHMLTQVDCAAVAGINGVAWDAVELPSQFMENWCWEPEALPLFSAHWETQEALPEPMLQRMLAARNFQSALQMVRQLEFALFDFSIHSHYGDEAWQSVQATLDEVRRNVSAYPVPASNRFQHAFSHIFAGGYAAGYYSYKWAEVLSADAFSLFEERGIFDRQTGELFLTEVLQRGGSQPAGELFQRFRGRAPGTEALLRHSGILPRSKTVA